MKATLEKVSDELMEPGQEWRLGRIRIQVRPVTASGQNAAGMGSYTVTLRAARLDEVKRLIEKHVVQRLTERGSNGRKARTR